MFQMLHKVKISDENNSSASLKMSAEFGQEMIKQQQEDTLLTGLQNILYKDNMSFKNAVSII